MAPMSSKNPGFWALTFCLVLCFTLLAVGVHRNTVAINLEHRSLCAQQLDVHTRLKQTKDFIRRVDGAPFIELGGVKYTRAQIVHSEVDLQHQYDALKDIPCS